ncbi:hypothetical protein ABGV42_01540 [Paenibacillus pabuli]|uniref:hypothetical protein n=1 Tax=Paenibacillus pabuli TaxID=1472 RepID=UPI003241C92B
MSKDYQDIRPESLVPGSLEGFYSGTFNMNEYLAKKFDGVDIEGQFTFSVGVDKKATMLRHGSNYVVVSYFPHGQGHILSVTDIKGAVEYLSTFFIHEEDYIEPIIRETALHHGWNLK